MVNKSRKPSATAPRRSARKTRKRKAKPISKAKRRIRRSTKSTQVTGLEIDQTFEDLCSKTPLEVKNEEQVEQLQDELPNLFLSASYEEGSPIDPDVDVDDEPENRTKMYSVPPKSRSEEPETTKNEDHTATAGPSSSALNQPNEPNDPPDVNVQASRAFDCYFS